MSDPLKSAWLEMAELIATRLRSLVLMDEVEVIVDQQKDLEVKIATAVAKLKGATVVILWTGGGFIERAKKTSSANYAIRLYGCPILKPTAVPVDVLTQAAMFALHDWHPNANAGGNDKFLVIDDPQLLPHKTYVAYEFPIRGRVMIPKPQFA